VWRDAPSNLARPVPDPAPGEPRPFELGQLAAATYLNDIVTPRLTLTFDEGWFARRSYVDGWSVFVPEGAGEVDSARLQIGFPAGCLDPESPETVLLGPRPTDVIEYIQDRDDLDSSAAGAINLGGYTGLSIEVTGKRGTGCGDEPEFESWSLFESGEDHLGLVVDEHLRLISLDVRGTTVSLLVFSFGDQGDDYYLTYAEPLLRTITFPDE
jgi:hypothetical protein